MSKYRAHRTEGSKSRWRAVLLLAATIALGVVGLGASAASAATSAVPFGFAVSGTASLTGSAITLGGSGLASSLGIVSYKANGMITGDNPTTGVITDTLGNRPPRPLRNSPDTTRSLPNE